MKPFDVFLANVYTLIHINYSLVINNFVVLAYQLKYNLSLYPKSNLKGDIPIDLCSSIACAKFITNNNFD